MSWKERIINTISGKKTDHLPFVPRLDIWYKSNKLKGTLPEKYKNSTLREIVTDLGLGFHTVVPDFTDFRSRESAALVGLGIYDMYTNPYRINTENLDFEFKTGSGGITETIFKTPYGKIKTVTVYDRRMEASGATIGHTLEHAFKTADDIKAIEYIFERIEASENYSDFAEFKESIGDNGVCIAFCMLSASPMHHIMKNLSPFEKFVYELNDNPAALEELSGKIEILFNKVVGIAASSDSEIMFCGANYDSFLTWPAFFHKYITPFLKKYSSLAHKYNKYFLTHTDGENMGLISEYIEGGIDVADSICPFPMTRLKLADIRNGLGENITIWGGLPSICALEDSMNEYEFDRFMDGLLSSLGKGGHIILSFADTTPPNAKFARILKVARLAENFRF